MILMKNMKIFLRLKTLFTHRWKIKIKDSSGNSVATLRYTTKEYDELLLEAKFECLSIQEIAIKSIKEKNTLF